MDTWEVKQIQKFLKQVLKKQKLKYSEIASKLNVSEMTIKRLLSGPDLSIGKISAVGELINLSFQQIVTGALSHKRESFYFSEEQETFLSENLHLYYFLDLLSPYDGQELHELDGLNPQEVYSYLRKLEKINLLELFPNNQFKLKCHWPITWMTGGPLQKKLMMTRHIEYIKYLTNNFHEKNIFISSGEGGLTEKSFKEMENDYRSLFDKYAALRVRDSETNPSEKLIKHIWLHGAGSYNRNMSDLLKETPSHSPR